MGVVARGVRLAAVPAAGAARAAGASVATAFGSATAQAKANAATLNSLTNALATARGPALKLGQNLATFAQAIGDDAAAASLGSLYENATPRPLKKLKHQTAQLPKGVHIDPEAVNAASLGQVHKGRWRGEDVAIKLQYPDSAKLVKADMAQLRAMSGLVAKAFPTLDVKALITEHAERLAEELQYTREAEWQTRFGAAWNGPRVHIPEVKYATDQVLITEWVDGVPLREVNALPAHRRDKAGQTLAEFCMYSPHRVGATHADPHPGNFRIDDGDRLVVLDFGSIAHPSGAFTYLFADTIKLTSVGEDEAALQAWKTAGLVTEDTTSEQLRRMLDVDERLYLREEFTFTPEWAKARTSQYTDPVKTMKGATHLRFPPEYLLEHRAVVGTLALLCSIDATVKYRHIIDTVLATYPTHGSSRTPHTTATAKTETPSTVKHPAK